MKKIFCILILISVSSVIFSQDLKIKVWPDGAPNDNGMKLPEEIMEGNRLRNISEAEMFFYFPEKTQNTGAAIVICPGGGYVIEAMEHEGHQVAKWLAGKGITGIVLKYRLPYGNNLVPLTDAQQAIRIVRLRAAEWNINTEKIGIAGSSAGGHLASTAGTKFDNGNKNSFDRFQKISSRPDFMLLLYPVISFNESFGHMGSKKNLIGEVAKPDLIEIYSNELHVTESTPPTFLILSDDDKAVPSRNSIEFYLALKRNNVPAEMHIFAKGGHGYGISKRNQSADQWPELFYQWLKAMAIIN